MTAFTLSGDDGRSAALVELYALLLEKEGSTPPDEIELIRDEASALADEARSLGKAVLTLDALMMMAVTTAQERAGFHNRDKDEEETPAPKAERKAWNAPFELGEIVCAGVAGAPARLVKLFSPEQVVSPDDSPDHQRILDNMRGKANIRLPRSTGVVTVEAAALRRATPDEVQAYHDAGGR